jgi:nitrate reductase gamma subunit
MYWYHWISLGSLGICLAASSFHFFRLLRMGKPTDYSFPSGNIASSIRYSFTGAMNPFKKESAYLHFPTYISGIIYHLGTFLSIGLFFLLWTDLNIPDVLTFSFASFLLISFSCGMGILIKRLMTKGLRDLSDPDDYISNLLVTLFHIMTGIVLLWDKYLPVYFILATLLMMYFPFGKLKHAIYFFAARYHLGFFYGWRGIWPPKQI